ncbi:unnamed protein product [Clavelina lepadiformis]|uniref:Retrotransposon gag domain-containing protein n=1 Tax=Clavelina lepadiformis TaxID=159417 RepID=A0ABP0FN21_CLALP
MDPIFFLPRPFYKAGDDLRRFLYLFHSYCRLTKLSDEAKKPFFLASIQEMFLQRLSYLPVAEMSLEDVVYQFELIVDYPEALYRMRKSFFNRRQLRDESACDYVKKVNTLGRRAYPTDERLRKDLMFLCVMKGLRDPQMVTSLPETVFEEKDFDYLYSFITNPQKAVEAEEVLSLGVGQEDDSGTDEECGRTDVSDDGQNEADESLTTSVFNNQATDLSEGALKKSMPTPVTDEAHTYSALLVFWGARTRVRVLGFLGNRALFVVFMFLACIVYTSHRDLIHIPWDRGKVSPGWSQV